MNSEIPYTVQDVKGKTIYKVNGHYFEICYRCDQPISVTPDMIKAMASFAEDETREGNRSFPYDAIPFDIWGEKDYLAW